jgi:hypothetical protein
MSNLLFVVLEQTDSSSARAQRTDCRKTTKEVLMVLYISAILGITSVSSMAVVSSG